MRLLFIFLFTAIAGIHFGCQNSGGQNKQETRLSNTSSDTLIYSNPQNYRLVLDDVKKSRKFEVRSYQDMLELFDDLNYTPAAWQSGIREIPRVYLPIIGDKWGSKTSKEITIENKKRLFFRGLAP